MIESMTGFGHSSLNEAELSIEVEVKSLNSKYLDVIIRLPKLFSDKELEVRSMISKTLERGKISVSIDYQVLGNGQLKTKYNEALFIAYYTELRKLADKAMAPYDQLFQIALNSPNVIQTNEAEENPDAWGKIKDQIEKATEACGVFRKTEGTTLERIFSDYISNIKTGLEKIATLDPSRIERVRNKVKGGVAAFFGQEGFDANRLEQEMIYYIEKLDIQEEIVRLKTHLDYFLNILAEPQSGGKKLSFISQEIGREINTIGSKANDAEIQKHVVMMKEELEKIKEQLGNVL